MKKIYCMLLTVLLLLSLSTVVFADEKKEVMEESGMTLTYTDEFDENNLKGIFESDSYGKVEHGVYPVSFVYYAMSREEFDAIVQKEMDEITEADLALLRSKMGSLATVYGVDRTQLSDRMAALLEEAMGNMTELASVGNLVFYSYYDAESDNTEEYLAGIAPAYQEEFKVLKAAIQDVLKNGEYYVPVIPGEDMVGKVFSFEGTDLDGNPIKSEDIFSAHAVTMINFWATWCGPCRKELEELGKMPLPPYIKEELQDTERYQTVYSRELGSAAAPTAGLHFTPELLQKIEQKGVKICYVTLHVGLGTFRPVKEDEIENHEMHSEFCIVSPETAVTVNEVKKNGGRVIAVGTTSCRTLESFTDDNGKLQAGSRWTSIFIYPGYHFKCIDALITNFHLPESTLIMLVSALAGRENILHAYETAVRERYRFFSFGDSMLIL